ncbi:cysteine hydrolase family protein [Streptomyces sp. GbtcB6]|uniref:cysteine hydrolase family protein n=1 Tax=Streptomyces sp. GbtcB6 TaxID=2824751 RepID=UPI001C302308|nr:cysteine hydrolase [Streptomyces sp. GbtcB6]
MTGSVVDSGGLLAVIDMQRVFAEPNSPWAVPRYAEAAAGVLRLLPAFGDRVVFTRFIAPAEPTGAWRPYYDQWPFALQPPSACLWELTDEFTLGRQDPARPLDAATFGKWTPELAERVGPGGRLVLAGVSTDCCVLSTALAAADAGVQVTVVADACAGVDDTTHLRALEVMRLYAPLIEVLEVDQLLKGDAR